MINNKDSNIPEVLLDNFNTSYSYDRENTIIDNDVVYDNRNKDHILDQILLDKLESMNIITKEEMNSFILDLKNFEYDFDRENKNDISYNLSNCEYSLLYNQKLNKIIVVFLIKSKINNSKIHNINNIDDSEAKIEEDYANKQNELLKEKIAVLETYITYLENKLKEKVIVYYNSSNISNSSSNDISNSIINSNNNTNINTNVESNTTSINNIFSDILNLETKLFKLTKENNDLINSNKHLSNTNETLVKDKDELFASIKIQSENITNKDYQIASLSKELEKINNDNHKANEEALDKDKLLEEFIAEAESLKKAKEEIQENALNLLSEKEIRIKELEEVIEYYVQMNNSNCKDPNKEVNYADLDTEINKDTNTNITSNSKFPFLINRKTIFTYDINQQQRETISKSLYQELQEHNNKLTQKIQELKMQISLKQNQLEEQVKENELIQKQKEDLEHYMKETIIESEQVQLKLNTKQSELEEITQENIEMKSQNNNLLVEKKQLQEKILLLEKEKKSMLIEKDESLKNSENHNWNEILILKEERNQLLSRIDFLELNSNEIKQDIRNKENEIGRCKDKIVIFSKENELCRIKIKKLEKKYSILKEEIKKYYNNYNSNNNLNNNADSNKGFIGKYSDKYECSDAILETVESYESNTNTNNTNELDKYQNDSIPKDSNVFYNKGKLSVNYQLDWILGEEDCTNNYNSEIPYNNKDTEDSKATTKEFNFKKLIALEKENINLRSKLSAITASNNNAFRIKNENMLLLKEKEKLKHEITSIKKSHEIQISDLERKLQYSNYGINKKEIIYDTDSNINSNEEEVVEPRNSVFQRPTVTNYVNYVYKSNIKYSSYGDDSRLDIKCDKDYNKLKEEIICNQKEFELLKDYSSKTIRILREKIIEYKTIIETLLSTN